MLENKVIRTGLTLFAAGAFLLTTLVITILLLLPLIRTRSFNRLEFRLLYLSFVLIWVVIFNYKAESPTYIIAMTGVAVWFVIRARKNADYLLLSLAILFTVLSPTDLFPKGIRNTYIIPYMLKGLPCILIWFRILFELIFLKTKNHETNLVSNGTSPSSYAT